jgi:hypothetical protein
VWGLLCICPTLYNIFFPDCILGLPLQLVATGVWGGGHTILLAIRPKHHQQQAGLNQVTARRRLSLALSGRAYCLCAGLTLQLLLYISRVCALLIITSHIKINIYPYPHLLFSLMLWLKCIYPLVLYICEVIILIKDDVMLRIWGIHRG